MKQAFWIFLISVISACGNNSSNEVSEAGDDALYMFDDFPDSLFLGLYFFYTFKPELDTYYENII